MQRLLTAFTIASLSTVFTLTGLAQTAAAQDRYITIQEQRKAILDCRYDLGLRGRSVFGGEWPDTPQGGQTFIWIAPSANLSAEAADQINACADEKLGRHPSPRASTGDTQDNAGCPPGAPVLFGGATYCIGTR